MIERNTREFYRNETEKNIYRIFHGSCGGDSSDLCGADHVVCAHQLRSSVVPDLGGAVYSAVFHTGGGTWSIFRVSVVQSVMRGGGSGRDLWKSGDSDRSGWFLCS